MRGTCPTTLSLGGSGGLHVFRQARGNGVSYLSQQSHALHIISRHVITARSNCNVRTQPKIGLMNIGAHPESGCGCSVGVCTNRGCPRLRQSYGPQRRHDRRRRMHHHQHRQTNVSTATTTNEDGIYVIPDLHPATYQLSIQKDGFRTVIQPSLQLYAQDAVNENFTLAIGLRSESITVNSNVFGLQTQSAAVSTVVNQQFVDNMPLNGRSFQSLIAVAPGVVFTSRHQGPGQFSVNGQRRDANYFMVDGVSANFGVQLASVRRWAARYPHLPRKAAPTDWSPSMTCRSSGSRPRRMRPNLDALPGRRSRSSPNPAPTSSTARHSITYERFFDARNYFDAPPLPKPPLRQNDFGGTFGGPIVKNKTFFFFSYEGLRLRLPQTASDQFYTASARAAVAPAIPRWSMRFRSRIPTHPSLTRPATTSPIHAGEHHRRLLRSLLSQRNQHPHRP